MTSTRNLQTQVLIVGAGPVGLTLALDLAQRGVRVLVAEIRGPAEAPSVKCNHVSSRSMEFFRRLGVATSIRNSGLPADYPHDVAYRTTVTGVELSRIRIPSRSERGIDVSGPDAWWPTPEPPHRVNQMYFEPVLFRHVEATPGVRFLNTTRVDHFEQNDANVTCSAVDVIDGSAIQVECDYLVGCDGGRSVVRRLIGARLSGTEVVSRVQSTFFRAPALLGLLKHRPAWATFALNPRRCGNLYAIDGRETWLLHNYLLSGEEDFDAIDRDWAIRQILGVDENFRYEVLSKEDWIGRRLVADRFRDRRAFICGDAAHLWVPMAGYGMNAGIADATNLSWLLAGRIQGWAGPRALEAYEAERQPITEQVSRFAMNHALALQAQREKVSPNIEKPGAEGDEVRAAAGRALYDLNVQQYCCGGLNFGYFYDASPVIAYDGEAPPSYTMASFEPSTVPGCRVPHLWLDDGGSLYDRLGRHFTLLRRGSSVDVTRLVEAAARRSVPLQCLDLPAGADPTLYDRSLVLVRPDMHVAWRGNEPPRDADALLSHVCGWASAHATAVAPQ